MENKTAPELLNDWLKREGRKGLWLASVLGVNKGAMTCWRRGHNPPLPPYRREIERITEGAVPASAWK